MQGPGRATLSHRVSTRLTTLDPTLATRGAPEVLAEGLVTSSGWGTAHSLGSNPFSASLKCGLTANYLIVPCLLFLTCKVSAVRIK